VENQSNSSNKKSRCCICVKTIHKWNTPFSLCDVCLAVLLYCSWHVIPGSKDVHIFEQWKLASQWLGRCCWSPGFFGECNKWIPAVLSLQIVQVPHNIIKSYLKPHKGMLRVCPSDEGPTLESSAFNHFTVAILPYQLCWLIKNFVYAYPMSVCRLFF